MDEPIAKSERAAAALKEALDTIRRIYWLSIKEDQATSWFNLGGLPGILSGLVTEWGLACRTHECHKIRIKDGWEDAGRLGQTVGNDIIQGNKWTPIVWDGEDDPEFHKTRGLDFLGPIEEDE